MIGRDLGVAGVVGEVLGGDDNRPCPGGESPKSLIRIEGRRFCFRYEPLLRGLLADAHALADVSPRRPRSAGLGGQVGVLAVREVSQMVGPHAPDRRAWSKKWPMRWSESSPRRSATSTASDSCSRTSVWAFLIASIKSSRRTGVSIVGPMRQL